MIKQSEYQSVKTQRYLIQDNKQRKVKIYIRTVSKRSIKIQLPSQVTLNDLKNIVKIKFSIEEEDQVLYLRGVLLNFQANILLENGWIIHAVDLRLVRLNQIMFQVKIPDINNNNSIIKQFIVKPQSSFMIFVSQQILNKYCTDLSKIMFIESARFLNLKESFLQQNIQNGTSINLVHAKNDSLQQPKLNQFTVTKNVSNKEIQQIKPLNNTIVTQQKKQKMVKRINFINDNHSSSQSNIKDSQQISSRTINHLKSCRTSNFSIQIGKRQCNCKINGSSHTKEAKFISMNDRKTLQKQIRQQNLKKLIIKKNKQNQLSHVQENCLQKVQKETTSESIKPSKVIYTQRKNNQMKKIKNPQTTSKLK